MSNNSCKICNEDLKSAFARTYGDNSHYKVRFEVTNKFVNPSRRDNGKIIRR